MLVDELWPKTQFVVTHYFLNLYYKHQKGYFLQKRICQPRQEAKLLYKMLKTFLIVLIFGLQDFYCYWVKLRTHALTGAPVAKSAVSMSSCSITLYLVVILNQHYYIFSQKFMLSTSWNNTQQYPSPAQLHNNKICLTVTGYPVTLSDLLYTTLKGTKWLQSASNGTKIIHS